jgi:hypothetical protein
LADNQKRKKKKTASMGHFCDHAVKATVARDLFKLFFRQSAPGFNDKEIVIVFYIFRKVLRKKESAVSETALIWF